MHPYAYACICMHIHTYIDIHACAQPAASVFADVYVGVKIHLCNIHNCPCTAYTHIYIHTTYIYIYAHMYVQIYTHLYICRTISSAVWIRDHLLESCSLRISHAQPPCESVLSGTELNSPDRHAELTDQLTLHCHPGYSARCSKAYSDTHIYIYTYKQPTKTHCTTLQHNKTHSNTLQQTATNCSRLH